MSEKLDITNEVWTRDGRRVSKVAIASYYGCIEDERSDRIWNSDGSYINGTTNNLDLTNIPPIKTKTVWYALVRMQCGREGLGGPYDCEDLLRSSCKIYGWTILAIHSTEVEVQG